MLEKLQKDPFFKSNTIDRASTNIKIKDIVNILDIVNIAGIAGNANRWKQYGHRGQSE